MQKILRLHLCRSSSNEGKLVVMSLPTPEPSVPFLGPRLLNVATAMMLATSMILVGIAAGPSLLRGVIYSTEAESNPAPPVRIVRPRVTPHDHPPPSFGRLPDSETEESDSPPDARPRRGSLNDPRVLPPGFPTPESDDDSGLGLGLKGGATRRPLLLRDRRSGEVLQEVRVGEEVSILREDGDWILVVHKNKDGLVTGWAKKSELLLR